MYREILSIGEGGGQLADLFQRTFKPEFKDNFQITLLVHDKLYRQGCAAIQACPRCMQDDETIMRTLIQCSQIAVIWSFAIKELFLPLFYHDSLLFQF